MGLGLPYSHFSHTYGAIQPYGLCFWSAGMSGSAPPPDAAFQGIRRRSSSVSSRTRSLSRDCSGSSSDFSPRHSRRHRSRRRQDQEHVPPHHVNKPAGSAQNLPLHQASASAPTAPEPSWRLVLDELAVLKGEVAKLRANTHTHPPPLPEDHLPGTSGTHHTVSPPFSGFNDSSSEDGEIREVSQRGSVLQQAAKALGPPDSVSADIDQQVAVMVNQLFDNGMQEEDYRAILEESATRRPNNCPALAPVECNLQILGALKTDAKKADFRLKDVSGDILKAGTILTRSLLALDVVAQESDHPAVVQEVGMINGALALLGHANHRLNLARRFLMKREINQKYSHLCADKVPMSRFLFGDDVSLSAKQIEDTEKLKNKFSLKKPAYPWKTTSGRSRGYWGRTWHRNSAMRFQPYGLQRSGARTGQRQLPARQDADSKNARSQGPQRPRQ